MASFLEELKKSNLQEGINKTGAGFQLPQIQPQVPQGQMLPQIQPLEDILTPEMVAQRAAARGGAGVPAVQPDPSLSRVDRFFKETIPGAVSGISELFSPLDEAASVYGERAQQKREEQAIGTAETFRKAGALKDVMLKEGSPTFSEAFEARGGTLMPQTPEAAAPAPAGTVMAPPPAAESVATGGVQPQTPQAQAPTDGLTTQSGIPLSQFLSGEAIPEAGLRAEAPVFSSESRGISGVAGQDIMAQASAEREARAEAQFGQVRGPDSRDRDRRMASGEGTSMADLTDMAKANARGASPRDVARGQKIADELGVDLKTGQPLEVKTPDSITPMDAANIRKTEAETAKIMSEIDAKLASGTPLTEPERLARERFEYEKSQDAESTKLARERFEYEKSKEPAQAATDRNIERLMKANPDLSYSDAVNIEQGVVSKTVNPLTGATETTNIVSGESTPVTSTAPLQDSSLDLEPLEPGSSLFERGQKYTGAIESGLRGAQKVAGQFGGKVASDESVQTKKELDAFQGSLVRAFQEGDRFSTGQDKVLREELDATLGAMKDPETFKNNAIALDKVMRQRHADLMENYKNLSYKDDFRSDSLSKARVLENAIRDLGVTQDTGKGSAAGQTESVPIPEGVNKAFSQEMWDVLTPEERATLQGAK